MWNVDRRYDADFYTLQHLLRTNTLGRLVDFNTHFDRYAPASSPSNWRQQARPGAGQIYDLGTHLLDQVYVLFGMPKQITAFIGNQRQIASGGGYDFSGNGEGPGDSFTVHCHYESGLTATARAAVVSPEKEQLRYWVRGVEGSWTKKFLDIQEEQLKEGMRPGNTGYGIEGKERYGECSDTQTPSCIVDLLRCCIVAVELQANLSLF